MGNNNSTGGARPHGPGDAGGSSNLASRPLGAPASSSANSQSSAAASGSPLRGHCYACDVRGPATVDSASGDLVCGGCGAVGFVERLPETATAPSSSVPPTASGIPTGAPGSATSDPAAVVENAFGVPVGELMAQLMGGLAGLQSEDTGLFFYGDADFEEHGAEGRSSRRASQGDPLCPRVVFGSEQQRQQEEARRMMRSVFGTSVGQRPLGHGAQGADGPAQNAGQAPFIQIGNLVMQALNQALSGGAAAGLGVGEDAMDQILTMIMQNDVNRYGSPPAAASVIRSLREETLTEEQAREAGPCAICQEDYRREDIVHRLTEDASQCSHVFHRQCIIPWLEQHNSCPVCRFELPTDDAAYNQRRAELRNRVRSTLTSVAAAASNSSSPSAQGLAGQGGECEAASEAEPHPTSTFSQSGQEATEGERDRDAERDQTSNMSGQSERRPSPLASANETAGSFSSSSASSSFSPSHRSSSSSASSSSSSFPSSSSSDSVPPRSTAYSWVASGPSASSSARSSSSPVSAADSGGLPFSQSTASNSQSEPFQAFSFSATSQPSSSGPRQFAFSSSPPFFGVGGGIGFVPGMIHTAQFPPQFFHAESAGPGAGATFGASVPQSGPGVGHVFEASVGFDDPETTQQQIQEMMQQIFTGMAGGPPGSQTRSQDESRDTRRGFDGREDGCRQQ
ncbi:zinc finger, C3HC4 type (RING finger) domain-containing protein [Toxoplasma gondii TgCatPRC2]|uniref:Zinc finger, C3HC4 type (RING finger) domain-containing protein n=1 Tax=Toxoplasma gondii TgCatPRC2 TaxID=1130821 RepID=A0A151HI69_TOXGO|nr:zinc finger, C3HC4 type (RING finger) domain-containing protein [Toxoplasma gondii TgCatPRC2]